MGQAMQIQMFQAIVKQDQEWWETKLKSPWHEQIMKVLQIKHQVRECLDIPSSFLTMTTNLASQIAIIRMRSSHMLWVMMGIHWANILGNQLLSWIHGKVNRRLFGCNLSPPRTWIRALDPQYIPTIKSFACESKEVNNFHMWLVSRSRSEEKRALMDFFLTPAREALSQGSMIAQYGWTGNLVGTGKVKTQDMESLIHFSEEVADGVEQVLRQ